MPFWSDNGASSNLFAPLGSNAGKAIEPKRSYRFVAFMGGANPLKPFLVKKIARPKFDVTTDTITRGDRRIVPGQNVVLGGTPLGNHTITFADAGGDDDVSFFFYKMMREAGNQSVYSYADANLVNSLTEQKLDFALYYNVFRKRIPFIRVVSLGVPTPVSSLLGGITGMGPGNITEEIIFYEPLPVSIDLGSYEYEQDEILEVSFTFQPAYVKMNKDNESTMFVGEGTNGVHTGLTETPPDRMQKARSYGDSQLLHIKG
jgi:hypothetical protein